MCTHYFDPIHDLHNHMYTACQSAIRSAIKGFKGNRPTSLDVCFLQKVVKRKSKKPAFEHVVILFDTTNGKSWSVRRSASLVEATELVIHHLAFCHHEWKRHDRSAK